MNTSGVMVENAITKIKEQIFAIVVFNGKTLEDLDVEYRVIRNKISEGVEKMKNSGLFADCEIKDVQKYAYGLLNNLYSREYDSVRAELRLSFQF